jgi:hypothetical protein
MKRAVFALIASLLVVGCEGGSPTQPSLVQVGGLWTGSVRLTSVSDGECVGPTWAPIIGTTQVYTLQITQNGGYLTATATETERGSTPTIPARPAPTSSHSTPHPLLPFSVFRAPTASGWTSTSHPARSAHPSAAIVGTAPQRRPTTYSYPRRQSASST